MTTDGTPVYTLTEEEMIAGLRALGADDDLRRALVKMASVGWTAAEVDALAQGAAAGTVHPADPSPEGDAWAASGGTAPNPVVTELRRTNGLLTQLVNAQRTSVRLRMIGEES